MELTSTELVQDYLYNETTFFSKNDSVQGIIATDHGILVSVKHRRDCEKPYLKDYTISYLELLDFIYKQTKMIVAEKLAET